MKNRYYTFEELTKVAPKAVAEVEAKKNAELERTLWKEERRGRITAYDIGDLFTPKYDFSDGKMIDTYKYRKAGERVGFELLDISSPAMRWGNEHEEEGLAKMAELTGWIVTPNKKVYCSDVFDNVCCTPDAFLPEQRAIAQLKCPYALENHVKNKTYKNWQDVKANEKTYYMQMQMELLVVGLEFNYFVSYRPHPTGDLRKALHIVEIPADAEIQEKLRDLLPRLNVDIETIKSII